MHAYLKVLFLPLFLCLNLYAKSGLPGVFSELKTLSGKATVSELEWKGFVDKVDKMCDVDKKVCEFFYMLESSLVLFEEDVYQDGGQCERAKSNVEVYFANQYPSQKTQVLAVVDKLCKSK